MALGLVDPPLVRFGGAPVHQSIAEPLLRLSDAAAQAGFGLKVVSGHRSFARQLQIWNAKARGERPVLDTYGEPLDPRGLAPDELLYAILRWSALPGASRHHWGTDVDVIDAAAIPDTYAVQLTVAETESAGPFAPFHRWLDGALAETGFFRPYSEDRGGIAPEPWHLSYAPVAQPMQQLLTPEVLRELIENVDILLKPQILTHFDELFARFVQLNWALYPEH